jgi:rubrerythrin
VGNIFNASEIVEIGIQIEKNGRDFYNTLVNQSENQAAIGIFKFLAGEEEKHISVFQKLLGSVESYVAPESYSGESEAYMKALAGEYIFTQSNKGQEIAKTIKSDLQAVERGIGFEKDSIIFYEGIKQFMPEHDLKTIEALISQEKGHLSQLTGLKNIL